MASGATGAAAKRVIVTGASSGIGRALCVEYARLGWRVGATARRGDLLDELRREVESAGGVLLAEVADASQGAGFRAAVGRLVGRLGGADVVVANAGVGAASGGVAVNSAAVQQMMTVNVLGVVWAFEAVLPAMLAARSGRLVAVGSLAGLRGLPGWAGYCASKAAVRVYCESLRAELAPLGVAVTCVQPGFVATPMTAGDAHAMPFLMSAEAAARRMVAAIARSPGVYSFPKRTRLLTGLGQWAPDWLLRRMV